MLKPSSKFLTDRSKAALLLYIIFVRCVSCRSVPCSLVVTFVTFPYGVVGQA